MISQDISPDGRSTAEAMQTCPDAFDDGGPSAAARMVAVYPPALAGLEMTLGAAPTPIGRDPGPEGLLIDEETVSRRHLVVTWDERARHHTVVDLGSRNGSRVDGATIGTTACPLADGAVLRMGHALFVYERSALPGPFESLNVSRNAVPGETGAMVRLRARLEQAAVDSSAVLVIGETGTGKERIAAELHRLSGRRGPLVPVNCSALSRELVESQLFGHARGAFTGANAPQTGLFRAAEGGTLFLDEVGELPLDLQPKLLRAIEQREVQPVGGAGPMRIDVRIVAATNRELATAAVDGTFRSDLYARLSIWELRVPPLRERRADLFRWLERLYHRAARERGVGGGADLAENTNPEESALLFDVDAAELLLRHPWPLNLRGLERLVHELGGAATGAPRAPRPKMIALANLPDWLRASPAAQAPTGAGGPHDAGLRAPSDEGDPARPPVPSRDELAAAFSRFAGSVRATAKHFGRDRRQIYRWLRSHGLEEQRYGPTPSPNERC